MSTVYSGREAYTVVLMGGEGVGKSNIISKFFHNQYSEIYRPTVEEFYREKVTVDGQVLTFEILDTSGSYEFPAMREIYIKKGNVFVLVFALDDPKSFERLNELRSEIIRTRGESAPIVVVGNKMDTRTGEMDVEDVLRELFVMCEWNNKYVECSALDDTNIKDVFLESARTLHKYGCLDSVENTPQNISAGSVKQARRKSSVIQFSKRCRFVSWVLTKVKGGKSQSECDKNKKGNGRVTS